MLGLTLIDLKIRVNTNNGMFGVDIPFAPGLNIIRAENSSGKSTCVNAIAYVLGLEAVLGPSRKKPFPRSVTKALRNLKPIEGDSLKEEFIPESYVKHSYVELVVSSASGTQAKITRDIEGLASKVVVDVNGESKDYFLGVSGTIGAAKSDNGFHYWLERFIGWKMPSLTTYDGKPTRLYLECLFPLFFIEQKRGWSEIQANTPTQYGIKNLKKSAIEFCLGLEDYDKQNKVDKLKLEIKDLESCWDSNQSSVSALAEFTNAKLHIRYKLNSKEDYIDPFSLFILDGNSEIELKAMVRGLRENIEAVKSDTAPWPLSKVFEEKLTEYRVVSRKHEFYSQQEDSLLLSIAKADKKISQINFDLDRYRQLKRLRDVGSSRQLDVKITQCPICDSEMLETFSHVGDGISPLSIEQNIDYLKNQFDFYSGIKERQKNELDIIRRDAHSIQERIKSIEADIVNLREDEASYMAMLIDSASIRRRIELENSLRDLMKIESQLDTYNARAKSIYNDLSASTSALILAEKAASKSISSNIITKLEDVLKSSLEAFGYDRSNLDYIKISKQTLRPELDGYDIVADSSASDYIRIIWSYTLALMELGVEFESVKHGGFVVFDEPRQHEASKKSFTSLLSKSSAMAELGGQVVIATSISVDELAACELDDSVRLKIFNDGEYILKKINYSSQ
ncbi:hypothetical protein LEO76_18780 [Aeromonas hydrophila]|uniref:ATP-binding protein n=1 Tax=Aeromonas TaxID=642 RepID=UPI001D0ADE6B|nr:ATP-binding protein [Aeromonas hydrophila]MCC0183528.1 hypothetical protein [Aeromonas hydrophila]